MQSLADALHSLLSQTEWAADRWRAIASEAVASAAATSDAFAGGAGAAAAAEAGGEQPAPVTIGWPVPDGSTNRLWLDFHGKPMTLAGLGAALDRVLHRALPGQRKRISTHRLRAVISSLLVGRAHVGLVAVPAI